MTTKKADTIKIRIASVGEDRSDVYVCMGSDSMLIQRDQPVDVPAWVVEALNNAQSPVTRDERQTDGSIKSVTTFTHRFPFAVL